MKTEKKPNCVNCHQRKTVRSKYKKIADRIQTIPRQTIHSEYHKLRHMSCSSIKKTSGRSRLGNKIVDAFTFVERLHTKGHQNVSFFEFWEKRQVYKKRPYIRKMLDFYKNRKIDDPFEFILNELKTKY